MICRNVSQVIADTTEHFYFHRQLVVSFSFDFLPSLFELDFFSVVELLASLLALLVSTGHVLFLIVVSIFSVLAFAPSHSLSKVFGSIVEVLDV